MNSQIFCLFVILSGGLNVIVSVQGNDATALQDIRDALINFFTYLNSMEKLYIPQGYEKLKNVKVTERWRRKIRNNEVFKTNFADNYKLILSYSVEAIEKYYNIRAQDVQIFVEERFYEHFEKRYQELIEKIQIKETLDENDSHDKFLMEEQKKLIGALETLKSSFDFVKNNITIIVCLGENMLDVIENTNKKINGRKTHKLPEEYYSIRDEVKIKSGIYYISNTEGMFSQFQKEYVKLVKYSCDAIKNLEEKIKNQNITFKQSESEEINKSIDELVKDIKGKTNEPIKQKHAELKEKLEKFRKVMAGGNNQSTPEKLNSSKNEEKEEELEEQ